LVCKATYLAKGMDEVGSEEGYSESRSEKIIQTGSKRGLTGFREV
jgi:hypothetical protein